MHFSAKEGLHLKISSPCLTKTGNLCCKQVKSTDTFKSNVTKKEFKIFFNINCKDIFLIYLLECTKCKLQYVGKCETTFNLRLNNHRKDVKRKDSIQASQHFNQHNHEFNTDAKFTLIDKIQNTNTSREIISTRLKQREDFWIIKLKTLLPNGLNHELNYPHHT